MASHPFKMQEAETPLPDHYVYNLSVLPGYVLLGGNYAMKWFPNTGKAPKTPPTSMLLENAKYFLSLSALPSRAQFEGIKESEPHRMVLWLCDKGSHAHVFHA